MERENLRLKEEEIMDDITRYEKQLYEQEKHFKSDKDRAQDRVDKSNYYGNEVRRKEIELAK